MKNIYSVSSSKGVHLDIKYDGYSNADLNQLLTARNLCYSAIEAITEIIKKDYPLSK